MAMAGFMVFVFLLLTLLAHWGIYGFPQGVIVELGTVSANTSSAGLYEPIELPEWAGALLFAMPYIIIFTVLTLLEKPKKLVAECTD
ncbi:MAG: hypothetical protein ABIE94_00345 [archaeon]